MSSSRLSVALMTREQLSGLTLDCGRRACIRCEQTERRLGLDEILDHGRHS